MSKIKFNKMKKYGVSNSKQKSGATIWIVQEGLENKKLKLLQASLARWNNFLKNPYFN